MLLPLLVGILVAKWVADAGTHSLYHGLLEVKCVPWLPSVPISYKSLDLVPVTHAMAAPVVVLHEKVSYAEIRSALRGTEHNGFPIVHATPIGQVSWQADSCSSCLLHAFLQRAVYLLLL